MSKPKSTLCDICGKEIVHSVACKMCGKKICHKCSVWWYYSPITDNKKLDVYCVKCWELGIPYRTEIKQLITKHNNKLIKIEEKWTNKVKQNKETINETTKQ